MHIARVSKPFLVGAAFTTVAVGVGTYVWKEQHRPPVLEVYVFALKSGRSMLIRTPDDQRILVDGGGSSQVVERLSDIIPFYSRRIDTIIITNTDGKNVSGLVDVINRYQIHKVYIPSHTTQSLNLASFTDGIYMTFLETVRARNLAIEYLSEGDHIDIGLGVGAEVLFPASPEIFLYSKASAPELLLSLVYKDTSILFMGNASNKVQKYVASSSAQVIANSDVLVVSHSASATNLSNELMSIAQPNNLVYRKANVTSRAVSSSPSSKKTKHVDPPAGVLINSRFNVIEQGTVKIISDGAQVWVETKNPT